MPPSQVVLPEVPAHITQRGVDRGPTFIVREDYEFYRCALHKAAVRASCRVHAYALMTNHVHLLVTPQDSGGLAALMQSLGRRYVQYFNHRYARTGTLWEGRFRSTSILSRRYFLACMRYIESNPVRAGAVAAASDYRWSSYRHNAYGDVEEDSFLIPHEEYLALAPNPEARRAAYRSMFDAELSADEIGRLRAEARGRPTAGTAYRHAVAMMPRWASLRHLLHEDVMTSHFPETR